MKIHSHTGYTTVALSCLTLVLTWSTTSDAFAAEKGRVEKNHNRRITRPQDPLSDRINLSGNASQDTVPAFSLHNNDQNVQLTPSTDLSNWNPWQKALTPARTLITQTAGSGPAAVQVDYDEIEKAYLDAIPPPPVTRAATAIAENGAQNAPLVSPLLCPSAHGPMPTAAVRDYWLAHPGARHTSTDMCACDTAIPSSACMQSREVGMYANQPGGASNQMQTRPGLGNVLNGTAVPGGNAAAAARMTTPTPRFTSPFLRVR